MEWTYSVYTGCNYGISAALVVIISLGVLVIFYSSDTGRKFVNERIIGVDPPKWDAEEEEKEETEKKAISSKIDNSFQSKSKGTGCISCLFCILAIMTLSITAVLVFQGCFLANTRLLPDQNCPDFPMDCFIFNQSDSNAVSESVSFQCQSGNKTQFPNGFPESAATCFGWIVRFQSTKSVLDQLGVCTGLLGLFTTLLAIIVYLDRSIKTLVMCIAIILCSLTTVILLAVFKWSFAPLSYAVLSLGIALGTFGLILFCISPKPKPPKLTPTTIPLNPSQSTVQSDATKPVPKASVPTTKKLPRRTQVVPSQSTKVNP